MNLKKTHEYLRNVWLKGEKDEFSRILKTIDDPTEAIFGLIAFHIENRNDQIDETKSIIESYEEELIAELPRLVDNERFSFLNWDVWIEPIIRRTVFVTDPIGASLRSFVWLLVYFEGISKLDFIEAPKSLEVGEKRFLEALNTIKKRYNIEKTVISNVEEKINQWAYQRKKEFSEKLQKMEIDTERFNELKSQIENGFKGALFDNSILKIDYRAIDKFEYRKFDTILNVPKTLLVAKASDFTEYGMIGAGTSLGESIAKGINQYIVDIIKKRQIEEIEFSTFLELIDNEKKIVTNPRFWRHFSYNPDFAVKGSLKDNIFWRRKHRTLEDNEMLVFAAVLGVLYIKSDLTVTLTEENYLDEKFDEPMVLINIKIVFSFEKDNTVNCFRVVSVNR